MEEIKVGDKQDITILVEGEAQSKKIGFIKQKKHYREFNFQPNAEKHIVNYLVQVLSPYNDDLFPKYSNDRFNAIFRGQSNSEYQLFPSAFRGTVYRENKDFSLSVNQCDIAQNVKTLIDTIKFDLIGKKTPHYKSPQYSDQNLFDNIRWTYLNNVGKKEETLNTIREYLFELAGASKNKPINRSIDYLKYFHEIILYQEIRNLTDFVCGLDLQGKSIPEDSYEKRQIIKHLSAFIEEILSYTKLGQERRDNIKKSLDSLKLEIWPDASLLSLLSLAQHSGVATRLLDWTFNFNIALYFACKDIPEIIYKNSLRGRIQDMNFGLWIIQGLSPNEDTEEGNQKIKVVVPPYGGNKFLTAQKGVFTYWNTTDLNGLSKDEDYEFDHHPLEQCFKNVAPSAAKLSKLVIPYGCAPMILKYLDSIHINAATIFPNDEGAAKYQKECYYTQIASYVSAYENENILLFQNHKSEMEEKIKAKDAANK